MFLTTGRFIMISTESAGSAGLSKLRLNSFVPVLITSDNQPPKHAPDDLIPVLNHRFVTATSIKPYLASSVPNNQGEFVFPLVGVCIRRSDKPYHSIIMADPPIFSNRIFSTIPDRLLSGLPRDKSISITFTCASHEISDTLRPKPVPPEGPSTTPHYFGDNFALPDSLILSLRSTIKILFWVGGPEYNKMIPTISQSDLLLIDLPSAKVDSVILFLIQKYTKLLQSDPTIQNDLQTLIKKLTTAHEQSNNDINILFTPTRNAAMDLSFCSDTSLNFIKSRPPGKVNCIHLQEAHFMADLSNAPFFGHFAGAARFTAVTRVINHKIPILRRIGLNTPGDSASLNDLTCFPIVSNELFILRYLGLPVPFRTDMETNVSLISLNKTSLAPPDSETVPASNLSIGESFSVLIQVLKNFNDRIILSMIRDNGGVSSYLEDTFGVCSRLKTIRADFYEDGDADSPIQRRLRFIHRLSA